MEIILLGIIIVLSIASIVVIIQSRKSPIDVSPLEALFIDDFRVMRKETSKAFSELREEISVNQKSSTETLVKTISEISKLQTDNLELVAKRKRELTESNEAHIDRVRNVIDTQLKTLQESNEKTR